MRQQPATSNVRLEGKAADRSHPAGSGTLPGPARSILVTRPVPGPSSRSTARRRPTSSCGTRTNHRTFSSEPAVRPPAGIPRAARLPPTLPIGADSGVCRQISAAPPGVGVVVDVGAMHEPTRVLNESNRSSRAIRWITAWDAKWFLRSVERLAPLAMRPQAHEQVAEQRRLALEQVLLRFEPLRVAGELE